MFGWIVDLIKEQVLSVYKVEFFVIDEVDLMLDMGFIVDVDYIGFCMFEDLQMFVFLVMILEKLKLFLKKYMENLKYVYVELKQVIVVKIEYIFIFLKYCDKDKFFFDIMFYLNLYLGIVFVNMKNIVDYIV